MIDNYSNYNKHLFKARYTTYEEGQLCKCMFSVPLLFFLSLPHHLFNPTSITISI